MENDVAELASKLIGTAYVRQASDATSSYDNAFKELLRHRKLPRRGWEESAIERLMMKLSQMDSNNFPHQVGVGEREGRVACPLVSRRHWHFSHGIGRSGDLTAVQPKAAGSSLLNKLCNALLLDAIHLAGVTSCVSCFLVPTATGMALTLCLLYFRQQNPSAKYVIWSRIDQKSCFKCITAAGLIPIVVDPLQEGDQLVTDLDRIEKHLVENDANELAVLSTTSCFAPRVPDKLEELAILCKKYNVAHLVNNAYGLQASKCSHLLEQAIRVGRVDAFVQSTDKNFLVPVGGAVIAGFDKAIVDAISKTYPGRASATPSIDTLTTLLWFGADGWKKLLSDRKGVFLYFQEQLQPVLQKHNCQLLNTQGNPISLAIRLESLDKQRNITQVGSMLFTRSCSGARVVPKGICKEIEGREFVGWGAHCSTYPVSYLNVAAAIGMQKSEVDSFVNRLDKVLTDIGKANHED